MKVLFDHNLPFLLAHGGMEIQIEQTKAALERIGVDVDYLRWWDANQSVDVLHYFGRIPVGLIQFAHAKGIKIVQAELLTGQGSRPMWQHYLHRFVIRGCEALLPESVVHHFNWSSRRLADACIALTPWEAQLMVEIFGAPANRVHVVPNGVEELFFRSAAAPRGKWLVCTATITERKRVLELAEAAVSAQTPLWMIGRPYADGDPYARRFLQLANQHPSIIRYEGPVQDRNQLADIYHGSRGFVLLSAMESLSLSALEAAAGQCPLLLSDLPWARTVFGDSVSYCPVTSHTPTTAEHLRRFYDSAASLPCPLKPMTWVDVAHQLKAIYDTICASH